MPTWTGEIMSDYKPAQVQGTISKMMTLSHSWRIQFDTQENVNPEVIAYFMKNVDRLGWITHSVNQIDSEHIVDLPPVKQYEGKTPSQRMRSVIFLLWSKDKNGHETFEGFYDWYMEKIIEKIKTKLI
jgi:hypothetical protein